jgi:hypothetical protein
MLWLILGVIIGAGALWLISWTRANKLNVTWYEWALAIVAVILALLAIQNFEGSLAEFETRAAWILLALFGAPALVSAAIAAYLVRRRQQPAKPASQKA